jgi:hypothetical protein
MKTRPVFKVEELMPHFKQILLVIHNGTTTVNEIYREVAQTGLPGLGYKQKVLYSIDYLERVGLIRDVLGYSRFRPGKRQPKELTQVGAALAYMITNVEEYRRSFSKLREMIKKYSDLLHIEVKNMDGNHRKQEEIVRSILRSRGFPSEIIDQYKWIYDQIQRLRISLSPAWNSAIIIMKYVSILSKASSISNDKKATKDILGSIIIYCVTEYLSFILEDLEDQNPLVERDSYDGKDKLDDVFTSFISDSFDSTLGAITSGHLLNNKIIESEATNVLSSIMSISMQSKIELDENIRDVKLAIEEIENYFKLKKLHKDIKDNGADWFNEDRLINHRKLLALYEQHRMKCKD